MLGRVWDVLDFPCPSSQPLLTRLGTGEAVRGPQALHEHMCFGAWWGGEPRGKESHYHLPPLRDHPVCPWIPSPLKPHPKLHTHPTEPHHTRSNPGGEVGWAEDGAATQWVAATLWGVTALAMGVQVGEPPSVRGQGTG